MATLLADRRRELRVWYGLVDGVQYLARDPWLQGRVVACGIVDLLLQHRRDPITQHQLHMMVIGIMTSLGQLPAELERSRLRALTLLGGSTTLNSLGAVAGNAGLALVGFGVTSLSPDLFDDVLGMTIRSLESEHWLEHTAHRQDGWRPGPKWIELYEVVLTHYTG